MRQIVFAPIIAVFLAIPTLSPADETQEGADLVQRGLELLFKELLKEVEPALDDLDSLGAELAPKIEELMKLIDDIRQYEMPEKLPNGDIIIRRIQPPKEGEIDL